MGGYYTAKKFTLGGDSVRALVQLLTETTLTEIEYQVGTHGIKVQRFPEPAVSSQPLLPFTP